MQIFKPHPRSTESEPAIYNKAIKSFASTLQLDNHCSETFSLKHLLLYIRKDLRLYLAIMLIEHRLLHIPHKQGKL